MIWRYSALAIKARYVFAIFVTMAKRCMGRASVFTEAQLCPISLAARSIQICSERFGALIALPDRQRTGPLAAYE
jgi:hypothetical protein